MVQPIAVKQDGTRVPAVERLCEKYLQAPPSTPMFRLEQRNDLFTHAVEPTLQRELKHKGAANGDGSYSAELIGYVEIMNQGGRRLIPSADVIWRGDNSCSLSGSPPSEASPSN